YFDRLQRAHFTECRNIAEWDTLLLCAKEVGLDVRRFQQDVAGKTIRETVYEELQLALKRNIQVVPTLLVEGHAPLEGAVSYPELVDWLKEAGVIR
ncbi:MAG: DsbA family protein, partial [Calditrichaeota bacterium]